MTLGIGIKVTGIEQVERAKRQIELLGGSLKEARELGNIDIHTRGLADVLTEFRSLGAETRGMIGGIRDMAEEMRRLQGQGGFKSGLDPAQIQRATEAMRQLQQVSRHTTSAPAATPQPLSQAGKPERQSLHERIYGTAPVPSPITGQWYDSHRLTERHKMRLETGELKRFAVFSERTEQEARKPENNPGRNNPGSSATVKAAAEKPDSHYFGLIRDRKQMAPLTVDGPEERHQDHPALAGSALSPERRKSNAEEYRKITENQQRLMKQLTGATTVSDKTEMQARLVNAKDYYKKLASLDSAASRRGGVITVSQAQEAGRLYEEVKKSVEGLTGALKDAGEENSSLAAKVRQVAEEATRAHRNVGGYQQQKDPQPGSSATVNSSQFMRRALGWGMAAAGVGTIAGFIGSSRSAYRSAIGEESELYARGIPGSRRRAKVAADIGVQPSEWYGIENHLSKSTGLNERTGLGRSAMLTATFAKANGVDVGDVTGFRSSIYGATGDAGRIPDSLLLNLGKGLDKSRLPELLTRVVQNTGLTVSAMRGAAASKGQVAAAAALAAESMRVGGEVGTYGKSREFGDVMQNGLKGGAGSAAGEIAIFKALGGFDGPMTFKRIHEMNMIRQQGFMQKPDILKGLISQLGGGDMATRAGKLETYYKGWGIDGKASELLVQMNDSGFLDRISKRKGSMVSNMKDMAKEGDGEAKKWLDEIAKNPALARQSVEAQKDLVKIEAGEKLSKLFEPIEMSAAKFAGALADGKWQDSFSVLGKAAGEMGAVGKVFLAGSGLMAAGGALNLLGSIKGLLPRAAVGAAAEAATASGLLSRLLPGLINPVTGAVAIGGAAMYLGGRNDTAVKSASTDAQLNQRLSQLQVAGADHGPEGRRIKAELEKRKLDPGARPRPAGYFKFADVISKAAQKYGVPDSLLAGLIESESGFVNVAARNVHLKSGKDIRVAGVAQLTEETAKRYKVDPMNPYQSIDAAARHLSDSHKRTGDWREDVRRYKGVTSSEKLWQVDTALNAAGKYATTDNEKREIQQVTGNSLDNNILTKIAELLAAIAGTNEATARNTTPNLVATPGAVR